MKNKIISFILVLSFMVLLVSCSSIPNKYYKIKTESYEKTLYYTNENNIEVPVLNVFLSKPVFKNKDAKFINDYFDERFDNAKSNAEDSFYLEAIDLYDYYTNEENNFEAYDYNLYYNVETNTKDLVSLTVSYEISYGGAHADYGTTGVNIDMKKNKILEFEDVFDIDKENDLVFLLKQKLADEEDVIIEDYQNDYLKECFTLEHFYFKDNKVVMIFNPYDIASYAIGKIEVEFNKEELSDILLDDYR